MQLMYHQPEVIASEHKKIKQFGHNEVAILLKLKKREVGVAKKHKTVLQQPQSEILKKKMGFRVREKEPIQKKFFSLTQGS